jgi:hypothetical protein
MKAFLLFLLIPVAMTVHTVLATKFDLSARYPFGVFAVAAAALVALFFTVRRSFSWGGVIWNILGWVLALFFAYWTLIYSEYGEANAPPPGKPLAAELAGANLVDSSAVPFDLPGFMGRHRATLLVFYRGYW